LRWSSGSETLPTAMRDARHSATVVSRYETRHYGMGDHRTKVPQTGYPARLRPGLVKDRRTVSVVISDPAAAGRAPANRVALFCVKSTAQAEGP